jgi:hypothetical protein
VHVLCAPQSVMMRRSLFASQIANSNNEGVVCKKNKPVGSISDGFSCDLDFTPFPADSGYVTRCLGVNVSCKRFLR